MKTGMAALEAGDSIAAYSELLPQAEAGNAAAQYEVGLMLDGGRGTAMDADAAGKIPVFGILKRGGKVYTKIIPE